MMRLSIVINVEATELSTEAGTYFSECVLVTMLSQTSVGLVFLFLLAHYIPIVMHAKTQNLSFTLASQPQ